jgi:hypothetical protein
MGHAAREDTARQTRRITGCTRQRSTCKAETLAPFFYKQEQQQPTKADEKMKVQTLWAALSILTLIPPGLLAGEAAHNPNDMADCPMKADHAAGVDERGDKEMGFSHTKTTHHFRITPDGGAIEVTANDAKDEISRDQIRGHLIHIAKLFEQGNFEIPMLVHNQKAPGTDVMKRMKANVVYRYEELENGARVRISTADPAALNAVHDFLRFQIKEHRTGDPLEAVASK